MTQQRKNILLAILGLMLLAYAGDWLWSWVTGPLADLRQKQQALERDVEKRSLELAQARKAARELAVLETLSLPSDPQAARSAYQAWLLELVRRAGLTGPSVDSTQPSAKGGHYAITFSLQARGTLQQWTRFLFEFYRAGHLHQIRSLAITPVGSKEQLDLVLAIEALVLPGADRQDQLSDQAYLTGIHYLNGVPQAWFTLRNVTHPDRAVVKVGLGESLSVGQFTGKVVDIDTSDVILESGGERWLVAIGEHLGQAFALPPEF